jgi:hypothetical protein
MEQAMGMTRGHTETTELIEQLLQQLEGTTSPVRGPDHAP